MCCQFDINFYCAEEIIHKNELLIYNVFFFSFQETDRCQHNPQFQTRSFRGRQWQLLKFGRVASFNRNAIFGASQSGKKYDRVVCFKTHAVPTGTSTLKPRGKRGKKEYNSSYERMVVAMSAWILLDNSACCFITKLFLDLRHNNTVNCQVFET